MTLLLINQTGNSLSYINGQVVVPANGSTILSTGLAPYVALDGNFLNDVQSSPPNVFLSDGVSVYSGKDAIDFISTWLKNGPPQNSNDPIAFTLAGMGFSTTGSATVSSGTETPVILMTNPSTSTVNARAMIFYAAPNSTQGISTVSIYTNPTVTSNGIALPVQNSLVNASSPSSAMQLYGGPSLSDNGSKRITIVSNANADASPFNFSQTAILTPGNSLLLTVTVSNIGALPSVTTYFYMQWVEV